MKWVLLFEDEQIQVKLVTDILKFQLNLPVRATDSLDEALLLAKENPTLIISDIVLVKPTSTTQKFNNDGLIFTKAIKENPKTSHIPVILRSTLPLKDFGTTLEETQANAYISKAIGAQELIRAVSEFIKP